MPVDDGAAGGRGRLARWLFGGSRRLQAEPSATAAPAPEGDVVRGETKEKMSPHPAGLEQRLPESVAGLYVYRKRPEPVGVERFGIRTTCFCTPGADLGIGYGRPKFKANGQAGPGGKLPADFLRAMRTWSGHRGTLDRWLDGHYHQAQLELVIWDNTGFRIPWELFWLGAEQRAGRPPGWLGAQLTVTRSPTLGEAGPEFPRSSRNLAPHRRNRSIIAFVDPAMTADASLLSAFSVTYATSMRHLFQLLKTTANPLAMVYIACRGQFSDRPEDCTLAGLSLAEARDLGHDLAGLRAEATLVFLNVRHSGSSGVDVGMYNDGALRGFAEVFLRAGAAGVLATTGAVGTDVAHAVARDLLNHFAAFPDVPVAEALRRLRAQAWHGINPGLLQTNLSGDARAAADRALHPLINPFMYVYYGG